MVDAYYPNTLKEALEIRQGQKVIPYAGGTDLMVKRDYKEPFLFINELKELTSITQEADRTIIGAACNYTELLKEDIFPVLKEAISGIAAPAIRNLGTIGGNICNASPAGDTLPVLYAMGASVILESLEERLEIPIEQFIVAPKKTILKENQLVTKIVVPNISYSYTYQKIGARKAQAISKLSFVGMHKVCNDKIEDIRIAFGAVGATIIRDRAIEEYLIGKNPNASDCEFMMKEYEKIVNPIDDQRSTAKYRKSVCMNLLRDYLMGLQTNC